MTEEEIIKGTKLIAEFMGAEKVDTKHAKNPEVMENYYKFGNMMYHVSRLYYVSSWDWLIPVWIRFYHKAFELISDNDNRTKFLSNLRMLFYQRLDEGNIQGALGVLVAGLTWHNETHCKGLG